VFEESPHGDVDRELFRGGVPQVEDWLRSWRSCRTPQSFHAAEANGITECFIKGSRIANVGRKAFRAMVQIMAFAIRARHAKALKAAKAVSLTLDDRGAFRVVSFKCALPELVVSSSGVQEFAVTGCLAVMRRGGNFSNKALADVDEDYSEEMSKSVMRGIERIATCPLTKRVDTELVKHVCESVRMAVADGCASAQKCLRFLAVNHMPNLLWCGRDRAHALRIATSGPLLKETLFKAWWDDTFNDRNAMVPDIQNSEEWLAKLELCQKQVIMCSGVQGGGFESVAKTLQFAKQRFDSMATPQLLFCVMFLAIAMLLAYGTTDARVEGKQRQRARRRLEQMPAQLLTAGLSASYSDEAIRFIRLFDTGDHDPALSYSQKATFLARMDVLFAKGRIWDAVGEENGTTPLAIIWKQARDAKPIYYDVDGKVLHLLRKPSAAEAQEVNDSLQAITESMSARVNVELPFDDVGMLFSAFDLARWYAARRDMARADSVKFDLLQEQARLMFRSWRLSGGSGVRELTGMAFKLCDIEEKHLREGTPRDNRVAWSQVLQGGVGELNDQVDTLLPMLHIYLCVVDSTCGVERDLGALARVLQAHKGPIDADGTTIAYCTEVLLDGPADEPMLGVQMTAGGVACTLVPTDFTRACASLWVQLHGRRFRRYKPGKRPGPKGPRAGTMCEVKRKVKKGMDALVSQGAPADDTPTMLGLPRSAFMRSGVNPASGKGLLGRFDALTTLKKNDQIKLAHARRAHRNPYTDIAFNPRHTLRAGRVLRSSGVLGPPGAPAIEARPGRRISVLNCCRDPLAERPGYSVTDLGTHWSAAQLLFAAKRADALAFDSPWALDCVPRLSAILTATFILAIAFGKVVIPRRSWARCPPAGPPSDAIVHFRRIYTLSDQKLVLTEGFTRNHEFLAKVIELVAALPGSKWKAKRANAGEGVRFDSVGDVRGFLLRARRVQHNGHGLLGGIYFAPQRARQAPDGNGD
jgi:hypothetical protein